MFCVIEAFCVGRANLICCEVSQTQIVAKLYFSIAIIKSATCFTLSTAFVKIFHQTKVILVYTEHLVAHVSLMRTACQIVIVTHFKSSLAQVQDEALCVVQNGSHHRAACRTLHISCAAFAFGTCTPSFATTRPTSTSSDFLFSETNPCADPQGVDIDYLADPAT